MEKVRAVRGASKEEGALSGRRNGVVEENFQDTKHGEMGRQDEAR